MRWPTKKPPENDDSATTITASTIKIILRDLFIFISKCSPLANVVKIPYGD
jgi:hypothetical protein